MSLQKVETLDFKGENTACRPEFRKKFRFSGGKYLQNGARYAILYAQ